MSSPPSQPVPVIAHQHKSIEKSHYPLTAIDGIPVATATGATSHYSLGFTSLGVFSTKSTNLNYGNSYNSFTSAAAVNPCSYLSANYCAQNYNNLNSFRYKAQASQHPPPPTHGYSSL